MQFNSFSDFINMGGHGFYVWLAFGVSSLLLALLVYSTSSQNKRIKQQILKRLKREEKLKQAAQIQQQQVQEVEEASS